MGNNKRVAAGTPAGGQFATVAHTESQLELNPDSWVSIDNPDDPTDMPIYEGAAGDAHTRLIPGTYAALDENDEHVTVHVADPDAPAGSPDPTQGLDEHTSIDEITARLDTALATNNTPAVQILAVHGAAKAVRDQHPDAATIDLDWDGDRMVPVAVRDHFGEKLPLAGPDSKPWQKTVDLSGSAWFTQQMRPGHPATANTVTRPPVWVDQPWQVDIDKALGTAPF